MKMMETMTISIGVNKGFLFMLTVASIPDTIQFEPDKVTFLFLAVLLLKNALSKMENNTVALE